jgi:hypothetical protein
MACSLLHFTSLCGELGMRGEGQGPERHRGELHRAAGEQSSKEACEACLGFLLRREGVLIPSCQTGRGCQAVQI